MKKNLFKKVIAGTLVAAMMLSTLSACGSEASNSEDNNTGADTQTNENDESTISTPKVGGEITVAFSNSPSNYDTDHSSSSWEVTAVTNHVYEGLFEFDDESNAQPLLAESYEVIDDGKTYDIKLRDNVMFHDNTEMTAEDVKASFERWLELNPAGIAIAEYVDEVEIVNDYEIKVKFSQVYAPFINMLASPVSKQKMVIKKKETIDKFGTDIMTEYIGTGPYKIEEVVLGQKVVLTKFDGYSAVEGQASGLTGNRVAYLDKITIQYVPEETVRMAGLESGQFDFIDEVSTDKYEELESYPNIKPVICNHGTIDILAFNCGEGHMDNLDLRKAVAYAINPDEMAMAQVGDSKFWSVEDGSLFKEGNIWYDANAGEGIYNANDSEKAKSLIEESGYNGETIKLVGIKADLYVANGILVLENKLKDLGLNVEVNLLDTSAYYDVIKTTNDWDICLSRWSDMSPDPQVFGPWTGTNGWITNWEGENAEKMDEIFDRMISETDYTERYSIVQEFYDAFWEYVPYIKIFNDKRLYGISDKLKGYANYGQPFFWNCYLED